jgi:CRISPR-associated Csx2 family protein
MRKVYLSFLGRGSYDAGAKKFRYDSTRYHLNGKTSLTTPFVQVAELEILGAESFDMILIAATQASYNDHYAELRKSICDLGAEPKCILLEESFDPRTQWEWFEAILSQIKENDDLTVDLTHGYRAIPILFSTAINFLQRSRNITLSAVFYGARDANRDFVPIIDMKHFYLVNEWADALSRLTEDLDTKKLKAVASQSLGLAVEALNDLPFLTALGEFTDRLRNVEIDFMAEVANKIIASTRTKQAEAKRVEAILLEVLEKKLAILEPTPSNLPSYTNGYFKFQLQIIRLLLDHRLYMQAYTAMREFIASLSMIQHAKDGMSPTNMRQKRVRYGEIFVRMLSYDISQWSFQPDDVRTVERLRPFYEMLQQLGIREQLSDIIRAISEYRNKFDHAWAGVRVPYDDIADKGEEFLTRLEEAYAAMSKRI